MRLDFVLVLLGVVPRDFAVGVTPRFFDDAFLAEEFGAFERAFFVGRFEDEAVAEVEGEDAGFFASEGRNE